MIACLALALLPAPQLERPRDPWVFRCTLDGRPRSVVVALADDLWLAYDATDGALRRAWKGDVLLQGAVEDGFPGAQPVSRGPAYFAALEGPVWFAEVEGELSELDVRWRGYAFAAGQVELRFEARLPDGGLVRIAETPERGRSGPQHARQLRIPAGLTGLARTWRVEAPAGAAIFLRDARASRHLYPQNVRGMRADTGHEGALVALASGAATTLTYFFEDPADSAGAEAAPEETPR